MLVTLAAFSCPRAKCQLRSRSRVLYVVPPSTTVRRYGMIQPSVGTGAAQVMTRGQARAAGIRGALCSVRCLEISAYV